MRFINTQSSGEKRRLGNRYQQNRIHQRWRTLPGDGSKDQGTVEIIVLLNSWGRKTRIGDANRIKRWMESADARSRTSRRG